MYWVVLTLKEWCQILVYFILIMIGLMVVCFFRWNDDVHFVLDQHALAGFL
jgi:hypothetical protein